ncbi:MAG: extracellular solute-binding protein [Candidatus Pacebacteria bacterium]|nr:extracellular solute-binding protein [Candidatus Paceibacterota bacterium]MDD5721893.1 extracellular solute-binding protein [Candidatus Paceibacterota bacterium]
MSLTSHQKKIVLITFVVIFLIAFVSIFFRKVRPQPITLEIWGIRDEPLVFEPIIQAYNQSYPHVTVNYTLKDEKTYHEDLLRAFADNQAPDILMLQDNWLSVYQDKIYPLDLSADKHFNVFDLKQDYSPVSLSGVIENNHLLGLPFYTDTLVLYYNQDIFKHYNIVLPPTTWEEILDLIPILRQVNPQGRISRAAIALGLASNVEWEIDILSALMMQYGSEMVDLSEKRVIFDRAVEKGNKSIAPGEEAINFYTQFANPYSRYYTWNDNMDNSIIAFSRGEAVMMIGYNQAKKIIERYSPNLSYGVTALPQFIDGSSSRINYGQTMVLSVLQSSQHQKASWDFLKFFNQKNIAQSYFNQTKNPPARLDLINESLNDLDSGVFIRQLLTTYNWYQYNFQDIKKIFQEMINGVLLKGEEPARAIGTARDNINLFWKQRQ